MQFYQTRSHAIVFCNTPNAICIEKAVRIPKLPRVVLKANSQSGQQDQQEQDARTFCDHPSASQSSRETWCNNVAYIILHSAVEQQDTKRRDKVKKLIQQFESRPNKESSLQDLNKTGKINEFSEKLQKFIADMNNTEIFELCEISSKKQCSDCSLCWEVGIVYCICVRIFESSQRTQEFDKNNYDVLLIPGRVIRKNTFAVPNMDLLMLQKNSLTQARRISIHT